MTASVCLYLTKEKKSMRGTTPAPALDKIVEARRHVDEAIRLLRDARVVVAEQTNESTASGAPDIDCALYSLVGDDPEVENVLSPLDAILARNGRASEVWSAPLLQAG